MKWLIEAFGEPAEHLSFEAVCPHVRQNAISRLCWDSFKDSEKSTQRLESRTALMQAWINERLRLDIGYHKEWQKRVAAQQTRQTEIPANINAAWPATNVLFAVADLETTGLSAGTDEILEFRAVLVNPSGEIEAEFSALVRANPSVPSAVTRLTGITQEAVARGGQPLAEVMKGFVAFIGQRPVFFHNAPFDVRFLQAAATTTGVEFANQVYDTLPMARASWPSLSSYKLGLLAEHIGAPVPTHRGLADVKSTLAVVLAARQKQFAEVR